MHRAKRETEAVERRGDFLGKFNKRQKGWLAGVGLILLTVVAYGPAFQAGFIWDDDAHLTENPCVVGPLGLKEIWTSRAARICPLVQTTFWGEHKLWGLHPLPYHVVNILVHAMCGVFLWRVLSILAVRGAWLGAALWVLHPVQVESVAWVTELKNTQSGFFFLLSVWCFCRFKTLGQLAERKGAYRFYVLALFCGALAMASKSSTVVLPLVLGLCAWWLQRCWRWRDVVQILPFFLLAAVACVVSVWTQRLEGATDVEYARSWAERVIVAGKVIWFYAGKLAWPHPLIFIYPRWQVVATDFSAYLPVVAVVVVMMGLWWQRGDRMRVFFFAFASFVVALLPVLGVVDHYFLRYSFVGDHFQYLASMSLLALVAAGWWWLPAKMRLVTAIVGLGILGALTWQQAEKYRNVEALWRDTVEKNPTAWMAHNNLGFWLDNKGRIAEAIEQYRVTLKIKSDNGVTQNNLGFALIRQGNISEAIEHYRKAIQLQPDCAKFHRNLGYALVKQGDNDEAVSQFQEALRLEPNHVMSHVNFSLALINQGRYAEAIEQCEAALEFKPDGHEASLAHNNIGYALSRQGKWAEAMGHYQAALKADPDLVLAYINWGNALFNQGKWGESLPYYRRAIELKPDEADVYYNWGNALLNLGRIDEAIDKYREILRINPNDVEARDSLAHALALKTGNNSP